MKKIIGFIAALVLMITLLPLQQAEAEAVNKHYTVNVKKLDVREKPSPKAKIVGSLKKGTVVFVYNTEPGGWSKIKYNNKAGYIASSGLKGQSAGTNKPAPAKKTTPVLMKDITFGMTYEQVKSKETRRIYSDFYDKAGSSMIGYQAQKYNLNTHLVYYLNYNRLSYIMYNFNPAANYYSNNQLWIKYLDLQKTVNKEFGEKSFHNEVSYENYVEYKSTWSMDGYDVSLYVTNKTGDNIIALSYSPQ